MSDIYISYVQDDRKFVDSLAKRLEARGYRIQSQQDATPGMPVSEEIANLIFRCNAFIIVLSRRAVTSSFIAKELEYAVRHGKKILPILTEPVTYPGNMAYILRPLASIDARQLGSQDGLDRLVGALGPPAYAPKRVGLGSRGKIALYGIIGLVVITGIVALIIFIQRLLSTPEPDYWFATQAPLPQQTSPADAAAPTDVPVTAVTTLTLQNGWLVEICYVYIPPIESDEWGHNWLNQPIPPGYSYDFIVPVGTYRLWVETCTGYHEEVQEVQLNQPMVFTTY